jgi:hypothetical protein
MVFGSSLFLQLTNHYVVKRNSIVAVLKLKKCEEENPELEAPVTTKSNLSKNTKLCYL